MMDEQQVKTIAQHFEKGTQTEVLFWVGCVVVLTIEPKKKSPNPL